MTWNELEKGSYDGGKYWNGATRRCFLFTVDDKLFLNFPIFSLCFLKYFQVKKMVTNFP